jgi:hypothetical protein
MANPVFLQDQLAALEKTIASAIIAADLPALIRAKLNTRPMPASQSLMDIPSILSHRPMPVSRSPMVIPSKPVITFTNDMREALENTRVIYEEKNLELDEIMETGYNTLPHGHTLHGKSMPEANNQQSPSSEHKQPSSQASLQSILYRPRAFSAPSTMQKSCQPLPADLAQSFQPEQSPPPAEQHKSQQSTPVELVQPVFHGRFMLRACQPPPPANLMQSVPEGYQLQKDMAIFSYTSCHRIAYLLWIFQWFLYYMFRGLPFVLIACFYILQTPYQCLFL